MTETAEVGRRGSEDEPRLVDAALADALIEKARVEGIELLGPGGLLKQMTKAVLERALEAEMTHELGYSHPHP